MGKIYIYKNFERFWHWSQAILIIFLAITGFEVHGSYYIFGYEASVIFHRYASYALIILIVFAIFWHITTGEWKQYVPTTKKLKEQILFYTSGMFKGEQHPTNRTELSKLNPLQRIIYLSFKLILIPITIISGILYMFHKTIDANDNVIISDMNLESIASWHTLGGFLLMAFLIVHVYMTTTGKTLTSNIKSMITGYEEDESEKNERNNIIEEKHNE